VPRLILLNGPPASGKSTIARQFVDEHPLTLALDIDQVRSMLGGWRDHPATAGLLAREIALVAARTHLASGRDVVVPQFLGRPEFIEQLEGLAGDVGAAFHEVVLLDTKPNLLRRFADRHTRAMAAAEDPNAREILDRDASPEELSAMYDALSSVLATRPRARIVQVVEGEIDLTYRAVLAALG
jgi:predicted kinase